MDELLQAETSIGRVVQKGQQQYSTPPSLADHIFKEIRYRLGDFETLIDPQASDGRFMNAAGYMPTKYGIEIDNRTTGFSDRILTASCVDVGEIIADIAPSLTFGCAVANPPFGLRWKTKDSETGEDSIQWTFDFCRKVANFGALIASATAVRRLVIDKHPDVVYSEVMDMSKIWPSTTGEIMILYWKRAEQKTPTSEHGDDGLRRTWGNIRDIIIEEKRKMPPYNIWIEKESGTMHRRGLLRTYLSTRSTVKRKLAYREVSRLNRVNEKHPLTLCAEKETRDLLDELVQSGFYTIEPEAKQAIDDALRQSLEGSTPLMPITQFQALAYCDTAERLKCINDLIPDPISHPELKFEAGQMYPVRTHTYTKKFRYTRRKAHYDEETGTTTYVDHDYVLSGQDKAVVMTIPDKASVGFTSNPPTGMAECDESKIFDYFERPVVKTIAEIAPDEVARIRQILETIQNAGDFYYFPGQMDYLTRVLVKDYGLIAAQTGTGKTLFSISSLIVKGAQRALIVAPQATMRADEDEDDATDAEESGSTASQWIQELRKFAPYLAVFELFSMADYDRIKRANKGVLPPGVYVTYYEALLGNKACESERPSMHDKDLYKIMGLPLPEMADYIRMGIDSDAIPRELASSKLLCDGLGKEKNGIRCIAAPSMATEIGTEFDWIGFDEGHLLANLEAQRTQIAIRMQAKYRYIFTATPIKNRIDDIFAIMGWLCVPEWHMGGLCNAAWPFRREDLASFTQTFLCSERDLTAERTHSYTVSGKRRKVQPKQVPVISAPSRLLRIISPTVAYISKTQCNKFYNKPKINDVRVPLGTQQAKLYEWYANLGHVPAANSASPLVCARVRLSRQLNMLRGVTTAPVYLRYNRAPAPVVTSNFNPKLVAILELTTSKLEAGEQMVIVNARHTINDEIADRLTEAGVPFSRIDSTIPASEHSAQSNAFKAGTTRVMLMGIKCAQGHSFDKCPNLIVGSLEYNNGSLEQAVGRVDRLTSASIPNIYVILCMNSIEENMFDIVATKDDAAKICLRGERVPRDFKPVDLAEILADSLSEWKAGTTVSEDDCLRKDWPILKNRMSLAVRKISVAA